ncbi:LPS export ABC transporter periplasmic protein LptC [Escherichia coli]|nr:LPS export ABC transporter periplasmic protein LptC [Salmonella enterica subsp. enterica serovar Virchow]EBW2353357.1 LPS export ABC transporter periplasmic protein LptC [Salmonella enterica subsp. enterica serovar Enteritidis]EFG2886049.1 LPS export ABC transporter periplasmic protein LptC [Escherichia coli]MIL09702.1 LPS export ABC transporter periplasmic protein LptC [Salmonella enterica subsp. enterica serovar Enteritidis]
MAADSSPSAISGLDRIDIGDADTSAAFAQARRHSQRVRILKIAFPAAAIVLALGFVAVSYLRSPVQVSINTSDSSYVDGKLVMAQPQLEGVTNTNRPFQMTADRAVQDMQSPGVIELNAISARLPLDEKEWVSIDAPQGTYDRDRNTLNMTSPFRIQTTNGLAATLNSAFVDMGSSTMKTSDPVDITLNGSRLQAESMSVLEKGKLFVFDKKVRLVIEPARLNEMRSATGNADKSAAAGGDGG